jgi:hypothetical protein
MISAAMEDLLREVYADSQVSPDEVIRLRNAADEAAERLLAEEGREGVLDALCKSFDVTNQLLQESMLRASGGRYTDTGRMMILALLEAHIAHLRVTLDAFA